MDALLQYGPRGWSQIRVACFRMGLPFLTWIGLQWHRRRRQQWQQRHNASTAPSKVRLTLRPAVGLATVEEKSKSLEVSPFNDEGNDDSRSKSAVSAALTGANRSTLQSERNKQRRFETRMACVIAIQSIILSFRAPLWWKLVYFASLLCFILVG